MVDLLLNFWIPPLMIIFVGYAIGRIVKLWRKTHGGQVDDESEDVV